MKITEIDHIGIAIENIKKGLKFYEGCLNLKISEPIDVPDQKVRVAFMQIGSTKLELIEPLGEDSPVHKFIQKRGEGIHHICFLVDNIEEALSELKEKGVKLIDQKPRIGATGKKIIFLHPESSFGVLIELKER